MFGKIMVPVDLDDPGLCARAMEAAKLIAGATGASILAIAVRRPEEETEAEQKLEAFIEAHRGELEMDGVLSLGGSVEAEVRSAAEDMGVDLVVMASHDPVIWDRLFGSRAAAVALHSRCSVMVVR